MGHFSFKNRTLAQKIFIGMAIICEITSFFNPRTHITGLLFLWAGTPSIIIKKYEENIYDEILDYGDKE